MPIHDIRVRENVAVREFPGQVIDAIFIRLEPWTSLQERAHVTQLRDALNVYFAARGDTTRIVVRTVTHPDPNPDEVPAAPGSPMS